MDIKFEVILSVVSIFAIKMDILSPTLNAHWVDYINGLSAEWLSLVAPKNEDEPPIFAWGGGDYDTGTKRTETIRKAPLAEAH